MTAAEPALDPEAQIAQIQERVWAMRRARRAQVGFVRRRSRGRARH